MTESKQAPQEKKWYLKWWSVVLLLLTIGPFGFPFLWKSKDFNLFWKIVLTVGFLILTVVLVWGTWEAASVFIRMYRELGLLE